MTSNNKNLKVRNVRVEINEKDPTLSMIIHKSLMLASMYARGEIDKDKYIRLSNQIAEQGYVNEDEDI